MASYRRNEIVSGLFVLAAVALFALFAFRVGDLDLFAAARGSELLCHAHFSDVKTLDAGAKVTVAGRRVGTVRELRLVAREVDPASPTPRHGHLVEVSFSLDALDLRLAVERASVGLGQDGFLGRHYLVLDPGTWPADAPAPTAGEQLAAAPVELRARPVAGWDAVVDATVPILRGIDAVVSTINDDLLGPDGLGRVRAVLETLGAGLADARRLLDAGAATGVDQRILQPAQAMVRNLDEAITALRGRVLDETLPRAEQLLDESSALVGDVRPGVRDVLAELVAATRDADARLAALETDLRTVLGDATGMLRGAGGVIADNRGEVAETVRRLRRAVWQAEMALRKMRADPSVLLFGDDEPDLEAPVGDFSPLWNEGRAAPFGQREERRGR